MTRLPLPCACMQTESSSRRRAGTVRAGPSSRFGLCATWRRRRRQQRLRAPHLRALQQRQQRLAQAAARVSVLAVGVRVHQGRVARGHVLLPRPVPPQHSAGGSREAARASDAWDEWQGFFLWKHVLVALSL